MVKTLCCKKSKNDFLAKHFTVISDLNEANLLEFYGQSQKEFTPEMHHRDGFKVTCTNDDFGGIQFHSVFTSQPIICEFYIFQISLFSPVNFRVI